MLDISYLYGGLVFILWHCCWVAIGVAFGNFTAKMDNLEAIKKELEKYKKLAEMKQNETRK